MKRIIIISMSLLMIGCIPAMIKKQIIPATPAIVEPIDKKVSIDVKVKSNERALGSVVLELNSIYGKPTVEISAFRSETGEIIVMKKLYYDVTKKIFVIVSIINDRVLLIDTVHSP